MISDQKEMEKNREIKELLYTAPRVDEIAKQEMDDKKNYVSKHS